MSEVQNLALFLSFAFFNNILGLSLELPEEESKYDLRTLSDANCFQEISLLLQTDFRFPFMACDASGVLTYESRNFGDGRAW